MVRGFIAQLQAKCKRLACTAGEALDALTAQLEDSEFGALLIVQNFRSDRFFSAEQQKRLSELMSIWQHAIAVRRFLYSRLPASEVQPFGARMQ
ncbi:hypothetical protein [Microseira wollei]|uniref:Uncharacterized protein n=1 Tax=Microseira wollei NIES-4236 TaxID=2530354 RepID=A0AAV3X7H2_9CYAN|nr:hypothetical protein [Microseira wollei]GET38822.1 hypothetical protein MiSe_35810 [Microseira wollei NIES-4236]